MRLDEQEVRLNDIYVIAYVQTVHNQWYTCTCTIVVSGSVFHIAMQYAVEPL